MTRRRRISDPMVLAKKILREQNMVLTKNDGEYRVNFRNGREATAYYTDWLDDAVKTGGAMARTGDVMAKWYPPGWGRGRRKGRRMRRPQQRTRR